MTPLASPRRQRTRFSVGAVSEHARRRLNTDKRLKQRVADLEAAIVAIRVEGQAPLVVQQPEPVVVGELQRRVAQLEAELEKARRNASGSGSTSDSLHSLATEDDLSNNFNASRIGPSKGGEDDVGPARIVVGASLFSGTSSGNTFSELELESPASLIQCTPFDVQRAGMSSAESRAHFLTVDEAFYLEEITLQVGMC